MSLEPPRRAFRPLPAPPGGLEDVRTRARRRRTFQVWTATGTAAAIAAMAFVISSIGDTQAQAPDQISSDITATSSPITTSPTPIASPKPAGSGAASAPLSVPEPAQAERPMTSSPVPTPSDGSYVTGPLVRTHRPAERAGEQTTVCGGGISSGEQGQIYRQNGWCLTAIAHDPVAGSRERVIELAACRDSTSSSHLTFASTSQADLSISQDGKTLWTWSKDHPPSPQSERLNTEKDTCWVWSTTWTAVDQKGTSVESGTYVLTVTSSATELRAQPSAHVNFTVE